MTQAPAQRMIEDGVQVLAKLRQSVFASHQAGLPGVRLYVPERSQLALLANTPSSISNWQSGSLVYPDGKLRKIQIRHRGDSNPVNYSLAKKSWRIKTKRKALYQGRRVLSFVLPQTEDMIQEAVVIWMAHQMKLLAPRVRLVELFINDRSQGIYYEIERLDEIFLRSNNVMPVNIYKGDRDRDTLKGFSRNLFQSAVLWSKNAENNRYSSDDRADLKRFFALVRNAASSSDDWAELRRLAPYEPWAQFSAYQILAQSWHNDASHNMRLLLDDQSGTVRPIPWDVGGYWGRDGFRMDVASHPLLALYRRNSEFLLSELEILYRYTVEEQLLTRAGSFIEGLRDDFSHSLERDVGRLQVLPLSRSLPLLYDPMASLATHAAMQESLANRQRWLAKELSRRPEATWSLRNGAFDLVVSNVGPLAKLTIDLEAGQPLPGAIAFDVNGNGRLDPSDTPLPFRVTDRRLEIEAAWLANRARRPKAGPLHGVDGFMGWTFDSQATRFTLVADRPLAAAAANGGNPLTGEKVELERRKRSANGPTRYNQPVFVKAEFPADIWRGDQRFSGNTVIERPVRIEAGSNIVLEPGASIVFRGKLIIAGTATQPVRIGGTDGGPWGTFALQGTGTQGSRLRHLVMEGGSGGYIDGIAYLAMLSVHATSDIMVSDLKMRRNHVYDDMLHVVYGKQIHLNHLNLTEARSDAIDIDISDVVIRDTSISKSGNDCIDLMTSLALIERIAVSDCGDKGMSVGEASTAALVDSVVRDSATGVEIKDGSSVQILHSDFSANKVQINAYRKNWRYAAGGRAAVLKSYFTSPSSPNIMNSDKKSRIEIHDSSLVNGAKIDKKVMLARNTDQRGDRDVRAQEYAVELLPVIKNVDLDHLRNRRGAALR